MQLTDIGLVNGLNVTLGKTTLETSGEDVKTTLETGGEDHTFYVFHGSTQVAYRKVSANDTWNTEKY